MFDPERGGATAVAEQPLALERDRTKPVVVTGAAGFVGVHVCRTLVSAGWRVRALARDPAKAAVRLAHLPIELHTGDLRDDDFLHASVNGAGAVVHLAAVAIERGGDTYEAVNTEATRRLIAASDDAGAVRFVHMSQNGADSASPYRFLRSKGIAEDLVKESALRWSVMRPSVIFGREDQFVNVLARVVRLSPAVLLLPGYGLRTISAHLRR